MALGGWDLRCGLDRELVRLIQIADMEYSKEELTEAKRQIDSTIQKLEKTKETLLSKEKKENYKSQITLASRRIRAFQIAISLIDEKLE